MSAPTFDADEFDNLIAEQNAVAVQCTRALLMHDEAGAQLQATRFHQLELRIVETWRVSHPATAP